MDTKKFFMGTMAGGLTFFLAGWLIYGMALMNFMMEHAGSATGVSRSDEDMVWWSLLLGNFASGALFTYVFLKWTNISSFGGGFRAAAAMSFLMAAGFDFTMYGTSNMMDLTGTVVDILAYTVMAGIGGGVIGAVLGMGKKA